MYTAEESTSLIKRLALLSVRVRMASECWVPCSADMGDGLVEAGDHFDIQIQRQILIVVLLRLHRLDVCRAVLQNRQGGGVSMQRHAAFRHLFT